MYWRLRNRFRLLFLVPLLILIVAACGPSAQPPDTITPIPTAAPSSTPESTPTPQPELATSVMDIVGVWEHPLTGSSVFREFKEDGTITLASGVVENLNDQPYSLSESWFEGTRFMVEIIDTVINKECIGVVGIYEVQLLADGPIHFVVIEDECEIRARVNLAGDWIPAQ